MRVTVIATISSTRLKPLCCASSSWGLRASARRGSELVQARKVVNSARERAPERAPVPSDRTRMWSRRGSAVAVIHQWVWTVPTPGMASLQCQSVTTRVASLQSLASPGSRRPGRPRPGDGRGCAKLVALMHVHDPGGRGHRRRALVGHAVRAGGHQHQVGDRHQAEDEHDDGDERLDQREAGLACRGGRGGSCCASVVLPFSVWTESASHPLPKQGAYPPPPADHNPLPQHDFAARPIPARSCAARSDGTFRNTRFTGARWPALTATGPGRRVADRRPP